MADADADQRFTCSACGKGYRWRPDIAGRPATCKQCQADLVVPDAPGLAATVATVADVEEPVAPRHMPTPGLSPIARALESGEDAYHPSAWREWHVPIALAGMGVAWMIGAAMLYHPAWPWRAAALGVLLSAGVLSIPLIFGAMMITGQVAQMAFGPLVPGLIKITGVAMFGSVLADLVFVIAAPLMLILGYYGVVGAAGTLFAMNLVLVALPLWILFELDLQEFGVMAVALFVLKAMILGTGIAMVPA